MLWVGAAREVVGRMVVGQRTALAMSAASKEAREGLGQDAWQAIALLSGDALLRGRGQEKEPRGSAQHCRCEWKRWWGTCR